MPTLNIKCFSFLFKSLKMSLHRKNIPLSIEYIYSEHIWMYGWVMVYCMCNIMLYRKYIKLKANIIIYCKVRLSLLDAR